MTMKKIILFIMTAVMACVLTACDKSKALDRDTDGGTTPETPKTYDMTGFVKGADVSWLTEQEFKGKRFYDKSGTETECLTLLRSMGVNAIRLRVWVNPEGYYNSKMDVLVKAIRAHNLGMRLMIDFHYSDTWADPGSQTPPVAWKTYSLTELVDAVGSHTKEVLQTLKENGIPVEWVQVGNETRTGMLKPVGDVASGNFTKLVNAGYDAVKEVYPDAKVIVHTDKGNDLGNINKLLPYLKAQNARYDVIGLSVYPGNDNDVSDPIWQTHVTSCLENIKTLVGSYGKEVCICEIGAPWNAEWAKSMMTQMYEGCQQIEGCIGIFYWEPQCYAGWNNYQKGAFDDSGKPTDVLDCFAPSNK